MHSLCTRGVRGGDLHRIVFITIQHIPTSLAVKTTQIHHALTSCRGQKLTRRGSGEVRENLRLDLGIQTPAVRLRRRTGTADRCRVFGLNRKKVVLVTGDLNHGVPICVSELPYQCRSRTLQTATGQHKHCHTRLLALYESLLNIVVFRKKDLVLSCRKKSAWRLKRSQT